jgi:hypothetical protein
VRNTDKLSAEVEHEEEPHVEEKHPA